MLGLVSVLIVMLVSLIVTRVATVALTLTGLSHEAARFQARSALTGVGFTTSEAEAVVDHPVRRRIVLNLMLLGGAGVVTAIASLFISFGGASSDERTRKALILVAGLFAVWMLSRSRLFDRLLRRAIAPVLRSRGLHVRDYASLLHLGDGHDVGELLIDEGAELAHRTLGELRLREGGVAVLGVQRPGGEFLGVPAAGTSLEPGDTVFVYGRRDRLEDLDRRAGAEERPAA